MLRLWVLLALALGAFFPLHAQATQRDPDLLSLGVNYANFDKTEPNRQSTDFRGEYRWGWSFMSLGPWLRFHPFVGIELTTLEQFYGLGGFTMDSFLTKHIVVTWSEGVGLFNRGDTLRMGSVVEFRSMAEIGYRFDNNIRITLAASHISNAGLTKRNPGMELAGGYIHIPINLMENKHPYRP